MLELRRQPLNGIEGAGSEIDDTGGGARHEPHGAHAQPLKESLHALVARALVGLCEHARHAVHQTLSVSVKRVNTHTHTPHETRTRPNGTCMCAVFTCTRTYNVMTNCVAFGCCRVFEFKKKECKIFYCLNVIAYFFLRSFYYSFTNSNFFK